MEQVMEQYMRLSKFFPNGVRIACGLTALLFAASASAQFVWLDDKGVKQFSDQPPPTSVPANRILKGPGIKKPAVAAPASAGAQTEEDGDAAPTPTKPEVKTKAPPSLADRDAEYQKRKAEQAEKDKKAADESARSESRKKQCERLAGYQRTLERTGRIAHTNKDGEREYLSEQQLEKEKAEVKKNLEACK